MSIPGGRVEWISRYAKAMERHETDIMAAFAIPPPQLGPPPSWMHIERQDWISIYTAQWDDGVTVKHVHANERPARRSKIPKPPRRRIWGMLVIMRRPRDHR